MAGVTDKEQAGPQGLISRYPVPYLGKARKSHAGSEQKKDQGREHDPPPEILTRDHQRPHPRIG